jgi:predicted anti-sigma-YlaC factor YlaD
MDCTGIADLALYHLGAVTEEERDVVEAHLMACSACLKTYLAVKRAAERSDRERPRPHVRARLREEVGRAFPSPERRSKLAIFGRRIPLYQGFALAAVAAAVALVAPNIVQRAVFHDRDRAARPGAPAIDTSRTHAESLHIY